MTAKTRSVQIDVRADNDGTVVFPLSSEEPYRRYDGNEILDHSAEAVDLTWLNSGNAPLLDSHVTSGLRNQIGVIKRAWLEGKRLFVAVKFSARAEAQAIAQDVADGIVRNVSVGYDILKTKRTSQSEDYHVTSWRPREASFVPVPADMTVGMGRSEMEAYMADDPESPDAGERKNLPGFKTDAERGAELEAALNEIRSLAATHNVSDIGESFISAQVRAGTTPSIEIFRGIVRSQVPADTPLRNEDIGMTPNQTRQFSLVRLARAMRDTATAADREDAQFEIEACAAAAEKSDGKAKGMYRLPAELMNSWGDFEVDGVRSMSRAPGLVSVGNIGGTGATSEVQTVDHLSGRFIDNLRNTLVLTRLGLTMLPGLDSNVEIPGGDQNSQAYWLAAEDADVQETTPTFRKIELSPHDLGAYTDITRRMLQQSTIAIEQYVRNQLMRAMAEEIDRAGFYGTGASGQPLGVANTPGIGSVTFGAPTPTRDELIDMRTTIAATNRTGSATMVGNTLMAGDLMKAKLDPGTGLFLMSGANVLATGQTYAETNQIEDGDLFNGIWSDLLMGMWGSLELDRSTEAKFLSGGIRLRAIQSVDFAVSRVGSFVLGNDGA